MWYKEKIVISGDIFEHYEYEKIQEYGHKILNASGRSQEASEEDKIINRATVQQRARRTLRRLINANTGQWHDMKGRPYLPKFYTLTFAENITRPKDANHEWKKFIQRLDRFIGYKAEYVVVVEFQDRGAVHYHAVFFNLPYIKKKKVSELWGQGFIRVNAIDEVDNVGAYVSKYMGKDLKEDKLKGEKCYFSSRGLLQPKELKEKSQVECVRTALPDSSKTYETVFENEYTGKVTYRQYNLKDVAHIRTNRRTLEG